MTRKPDYVLNVWGTGVVSEAAFPKTSARKENRENGKYPHYMRITHRIKVYLKEPKK